MKKSRALFAALILAALPARCAEPAQPKKFWTASTVATIAFSGAIMAADLITTRQAIQAGAHESNPIMKNQGAAIAIKIGAVASITAIAYAVHRSGHERGALIVLRLAAVPSGFAAIHNARIR